MPMLYKVQLGTRAQTACMTDAICQPICQSAVNDKVQAAAMRVVNLSLLVVCKLNLIGKFVIALFSPHYCYPYCCLIDTQAPNAQQLLQHSSIPVACIRVIHICWSFAGTHPSNDVQMFSLPQALHIPASILMQASKQLSCTIYKDEFYFNTPCYFTLAFRLQQSQSVSSLGSLSVP